MDELHFLRPAWLLAVPAVVLFAVALARRRSGADGWRRVCDPHLLPHLLVTRGQTRFPWGAGLAALTGAVAAIAMAGPAWEHAGQPLVRTLYGRVMVLDLSRSMDASDVQPTRLTRARSKVSQLLQRSGDLQTGLVVFAGDAFAVAPLTDDHRTLTSILPVLKTSVMPRQGSRIDLGLQEARRLLRGGGVSDGEVIVVSDGMKGTHAVTVAEDLRDDGYRVSVLAVGTVEGGLIHLEDGGFLRGLNGQPVLPGVTLSTLTRLADAGGGRLVRLAPDATDLDELTADTGRWRRFAGVRETDRTSPAWQDRGPWLVLALLPLAALAFRRGWLLVVPLVLIVLPHGAVDTARAASQTTIDGQTIDRCPEPAATNPATRAVTLFRNGNYLAAAALFACGDGAQSHYNRGTALARAWRLEEAVAAFDQALALDPAHADARHNRSVVEDLIAARRKNPSLGANAGSPDERPARSAIGGSAASSPEGRGEQVAGRQAHSPGSQSEPAQSPLHQVYESNRPATAPGGDGQLHRNVPLTTLSDGEKLALEAALQRIPDDPAHLWRQKLALKYWRRQRTPPRRSDAW